MAWTTPKTWAADELLTASDLNQYLSDNLSALYALTQGGGRKNLLHNGAMQVAQRTASYPAITGTQTYTADRWVTSIDSLGTWTQSVEADAPTGSGFRKSLKMLVTANDASPAAGDYVNIQQRIEGQNLQTVLKGTTSAQQLTLSFWTKSNKTGVYVVELVDADNTRHVAATYTVVASATWEEQSITFPADLTGAFDNDANRSLDVKFWLAAGTTYTSGTLAATWASVTNANSAAGQTNVAASNSNYWMVTGVQLEVGSAATGFEFKNYDTELRECQRYYQKIASGASGDAAVGVVSYYSSSSVYGVVHLPTVMRATPTSASTTGTGYYLVERNSGTDALDSLTIAAAQSSPRAVYISNSSEASGTAGNAGILYTNHASAVFAVTADL